MAQAQTRREPEHETFEFDAETAETPDIWVGETFTNRYGDERAVLAGDSYGVLIQGEVKDALDWEETHHKWNDRREEWLVDVDGLEHLEEVAAEHGFTVAADAEEGIDKESPLFDAVEHAEEGASISVEYGQKNGNGTNDKAGEVDRADIHQGEPFITFVRDDGQTMRVKADEHGDIGLFTGGYHPFVGTVVSIEIGE